MADGRRITGHRPGAVPPLGFGHNPGTSANGDREMARDGAGLPPTPSTPRHTLCAGSPRLLGLKDGAAYLGVSDWTLREMLWRGDLPFLDVGTPGSLRPRRLVDVRDLDAWIEAHKQRHTLPDAPRPRRAPRRAGPPG